MANDFNRFYHGEGDTVEHMDVDYWLAQTKALVAAIAHLAVPLDSVPTATPPASHTPSPSSTPSPTGTPVPSDTPVPSPTSRPSDTPVPSATSVTTALPSTPPPSLTPDTGTFWAYLPIAEANRP